jgi:UDP-glucose 6-dehydrogenase
VGWVTGACLADTGNNMVCVDGDAAMAKVPPTQRRHMIVFVTTVD